MSHFSTITTKVTNTAVLVNSLRDLGFSVEHDADVRGYQNATKRAAIVCRLEGEADLGWIESPDGTLSLVADLWAVARKYNQTELINSINQKYAINQTLAAVQTNPGLQKARVAVCVG